MSYNIDAVINYETDDEYRTALEAQLHIELEAFILEEGTVPLLGEIYSQTKDIQVFADLYEKSAAIMFSTNLETGLVVLFCYDFFKIFHRILCDFYRGVVIDADNVNVKMVVKVHCSSN